MTTLSTEHVTQMSSNTSNVSVKEMVMAIESSTCPTISRSDDLLSDINKIGLRYEDLEVRQKNLEEIFIDLVKK